MASTWVSGRASGPSTLRRTTRALRFCAIEARPAVLAVSMLRFLAGATLALPVAVAADPAKVLQGAAAWVLSIFAIYVGNGVSDVHEDRVNGSRRPIARNDLDPRTATAAAAVTAALSLVATAGLPAAMTWVIAANLILGYLYSGAPFRLKRRSGGTVAVLCGSGLLAYWGGFTVVVNGADGATPLTLIMFATAATCWMTLVGIPAKDLSDIEGDAAAGRRTIAVIWGARVARNVMSAAALLLAGAFWVASVALSVPLAETALAMFAGAVAVTLAGRTADADAARLRRRRPYRAFMATQYVVHITVLSSNIGKDMLLL
ncbi:UbiA family prenyltransferase [Herbidospora mongoliensis]|uniref:UbiA family prenyltransferase n=1 Tax=Herbidospora mongoliensis TaxID=688067 RepID=UPI000834F528|nr:UbiA family prenyltransferase [Herbidospora mongoliensis]